MGRVGIAHHCTNIIVEWWAMPTLHSDKNAFEFDIQFTTADITA